MQEWFGDHLFDVLHIFATLGLGVAGVVWGVFRFAAGRYIKDEEGWKARVEHLDTRVSTIERHYITRETLESSLSRLQEEMQKGFGISNARLDGVYQLLAQRNDIRTSR